MKATIVLIADNDVENFGRMLMLKAHQIGNLGFEMARLPQHVSLKQPFSIPSLEEFEKFFDEYAKRCHKAFVEFEEVEVCPNNVLGGKPSGCLSIRVKDSKELRDMQKDLFESLEERFGPCPADHDNDYVFHMTFALGVASFESYKKAYDELKNMKFEQTYSFGRLGLLYYDDDNILPGTYFCYKVVDLCSE